MEAYEDLMTELEAPRPARAARSSSCRRPSRWPSGGRRARGSRAPSCACSWPTPSGCCASRCWPRRSPTTPTCDASLAEYFPPPVVERFGAPDGRAPAAARDRRHHRHQRRHQLDGHHLRVADGGRDRRRRRGGRRAFIVARDVSDAREPLGRRRAARPGGAERRPGRADERRRRDGRGARPLVPAPTSPTSTCATEVELARGPFAELVACMGDIATTAWRLTRDERLERPAGPGRRRRRGPVRGDRPRPRLRAGHHHGRPRLLAARSPMSPTPSSSSASGCTWT